MLQRFGVGVLVAAFIGLAGCDRGPEGEIEDYLTFYYPTTGRVYYQMAYDWGDYLIETGPSADEELHPDSEPYRGFVTMRPAAGAAPPDPAFAMYLATPEGEVWRADTGTDIAETSQREEVTVETTDNATATTTMTVQSYAEPVIDDFLANPDRWTRYGTLTVDGEETSFEAAEAG